MHINMTDIKDVGAINLNDDTAPKLFLMEEILQIFTPLFSIEIDRKQQQLESNKQDYRELRDKVTQSKNQLQSISQELRREKLVSSVLREMKMLIDKDCVYGKTKKFVLDTFHGLSSASGEDLELSLSQLRQLNQKANKQTQ